jgi:Flp pilus assembly protein TadG
MPKTLLRRLVSSRDGSVILETALMITILLVLMFGIIDLGRALFTANNLTSAAREGARFAAVQDLPLDVADSAAIRTMVKNHFSQFGGPALTDANIKLDATGSLGAQALRVTINYPFTWITPIRALVGNMTNTLHGQAEYHLEQQ